MGEVLPYDMRKAQTERLDRALVIIHQFGKDLMWIRSLASRLERADKPAAHHQSASTIRQISEEMTRAVRDFLCPETEDDASASVQRTVDASVCTVARTHRGQRFAVSIDEDVASLRVHELVADVLTNLLDNAADASTPDVAIRLVAQSAGGEIRFEVVDEGIGMEPSTLARCFERGFTTKSAAGGTGTGLFASKRLADSLGAELQLQSSPGKGTRAALTIPIG